MSLPIVQDPFQLRSYGLSDADLPDRLALEATESPRLVHGGHLPHAGRKNLWELPAAVGRYAGSREFLRLRLATENRSQTLPRDPELPLPTVAERAMRVGETVLGSGHSPELDALHLFDAVQSHGDALHRLLDLDGVRFVDGTIVQAGGWEVELPATIRATS